MNISYPVPSQAPTDPISANVRKIRPLPLRFVQSQTLDQRPSSSLSVSPAAILSPPTTIGPPFPIVSAHSIHNYCYSPSRSPIKRRLARSLTDEEEEDRSHLDRVRRRSSGPPFHSRGPGWNFSLGGNGTKKLKTSVMVIDDDEVAQTESACPNPFEVRDYKCGMEMMNVDGKVKVGTNITTSQLSDMDLKIRGYDDEMGQEGDERDSLRHGVDGATPTNITLTPTASVNETIRMGEWPKDVDEVFIESLYLLPRLDRRKKIFVNGFPWDQEELISERIRLKLGVAMSSEEISNHIQELKQKANIHLMEHTYEVNLETNDGFFYWSIDKVYDFFDNPNELKLSFDNHNNICVQLTPKPICGPLWSPSMESPAVPSPPGSSDDFESDKTMTTMGPLARTQADAMRVTGESSSSSASSYDSGDVARSLSLAVPSRKVESPVPVTIRTHHPNLSLPPSPSTGLLGRMSRMSMTSPKTPDRPHTPTNQIRPPPAHPPPMEIHTLNQSRSRLRTPSEPLNMGIPTTDGVAAASFASFTNQAMMAPEGPVLGVPTSLRSPARLGQVRPFVSTHLTPDYFDP